MSEKVQTKVYLPEDVKARIDRDERSNSDVVEIALREHYGTRDMSAIEVRIKNKRDELEAAENTLEDDKSRVDELMKEIERLKRRKENMNDTEARKTWERAIQNISPPDLRSVDTDGWAPEPDTDAVEHYAEELSITPAEFVEQYPEKREELQ